MIQLRSILEVADNTGARKAAMISKKGQITTTAGVTAATTANIITATAANASKESTPNKDVFR